MLTIDQIISAQRECCICRCELVDYPLGANNPHPVTADGAACDSCNRLFVVPAREGV